MDILEHFHVHGPYSLLEVQSAHTLHERHANPDKHNLY